MVQVFGLTIEILVLLFNFHFMKQVYKPNPILLDVDSKTSLRFHFNSAQCEEIMTRFTYYLSKLQRVGLLLIYTKGINKIC